MRSLLIATALMLMIVVGPLRRRPRDGRPGAKSQAIVATHAARDGLPYAVRLHPGRSQKLVLD